MGVTGPVRRATWALVVDSVKERITRIAAVKPSWPIRYVLTSGLEPNLPQSCSEASTVLQTSMLKTPAPR